MRIARIVSLAAVVLLTLACSSLVLNAFLYLSIVDYKGRIQQLSDLVNDLQRENVALKRSIEILERQLSLVAPPLAREAPSGDWVYVVGVYFEETEYGRVPRGEVMRIYARFIPGRGNVLITTTPKIGIDLQASAETAYAVVRQLSKVDTSRLDVVITVVANRTIDVVDGPSAGVAITALLYAELTVSTLKRNVVATGVILPGGSIGRVGGVLEKAIAAAELGVRVFLVPKGQSSVVTYVGEARRIGPFQIIEYRSIVVDVEEYLKKRDYKIDVVEVSNILDAIALMVD